MKWTTAVLVIGSFVATSALAETSPPNVMIQPSALSVPNQIGLLAASQQSGMGDGEGSGAAVKSQPQKRRYFGRIAGAIGGGFLGGGMGGGGVGFSVPQRTQRKNHTRAANAVALGVLIGGGTGYLSDKIVERFNNEGARGILGTTGCVL